MKAMVRNLRMTRNLMMSNKEKRRNGERSSFSLVSVKRTLLEMKPVWIRKMRTMLGEKKSCRKRDRRRLRLKRKRKLQKIPMVLTKMKKIMKKMLKLLKLRKDSMKKKRQGYPAGKTKKRLLELLEV